jgi:hypothetical protein
MLLRSQKCSAHALFVLFTGKSRVCVLILDLFGGNGRGQGRFKIMARFVQPAGSPATR